MNRPQTPKPPFDYITESVSVTNQKDNVTLAGTLSIPKGHIKATAILITGSGPQDRDETILGHKPFAVIADHLTTHGIAVLRMDDRGVGQSTGRFGEATTHDFATDISAAVDFLKQRNDIPAKKIGLIGHSEGGMVAPMVASRRDDIAFLILLAGPGITIDKLYSEQRYLILKASGIDESVLNSVYRGEKRLFKEIRELPIDKPISDSIKAELRELHSVFGTNNDSANQLIEFISTPWFRYFMTYNPEDYFRDITIPVLALNGTLDLQVAAESNLNGLQQLFEKYGYKDYTIKPLKQLNHLFQTAKTGNVNEYRQIEETFSPVALNEMTTWLEKRF
ncbi:alpha/beta hydrolase family protein [Pleionea sediminis]|uniref:alpha/beta hydrolase family protein n=1 Tax=Pleionea sediminis TaxID=2569479 RepID=UPI0011859669|nr:alpha/beta fold hydrolase [Pleionea sediminis]